MKGGYDHMRTRPFDSKRVGVFGLFCYIVAEDEWAMGRAHGGGEWWTFLGEGGE